MDQIDLSVIIVNLNTGSLTRACVESLLASEDWKLEGSTLRHRATTLSAEVVVVDNGSSDDTIEIFKHEFPWVTLELNGTNVGYARANNQGISLARGRYVMLLNPDTLVTEGALTSAVRFLDEHQEAGVVGCQLLNPDHSLQPSGRDYPQLRSIWRDLLPIPSALRQAMLSSTERRDYSRTCQVDEVSGAAMLLRRKALDQVGGLDEDFFFLGEDIDICWTLKKQGWSIYYLPSAQVVHEGGAARRKSSGKRISLLAQRAFYLLFRKHRTRRQARVLKVVLLAVTLLKLTRSLGTDLARADLGAMRSDVPLHVNEIRWLISA